MFMAIFSLKRALSGALSLLMTLGLLVFSACGEADPAAAKTAPEGPAQQLADPADSIQAVYGIGRVEPAEEILTLASETGGIIRNVAVTEGESVQAGALLMALDQDLVQARLTEAERRLQTQEAQVATDETALETARIRLKGL
ncbi:MAG: biotin/lipoyl-binding protein, partial [Bacteroidetes bacterium]